MTNPSYAFEVTLNLFITCVLVTSQDNQAFHFSTHSPTSLRPWMAGLLVRQDKPNKLVEKPDETGNATRVRRQAVGSMASFHCLNLRFPNTHDQDPVYLHGEHMPLTHRGRRGASGFCPKRKGRQHQL